MSCDFVSCPCGMAAWLALLAQSKCLLYEQGMQPFGDDQAKLVLAVPCACIDNVYRQYKCCLQASTSLSCWCKLRKAVRHDL